MSVRIDTSSTDSKKIVIVNGECYTEFSLIEVVAN